MIARGALRPKSRFGAALGPFRLLEVTYYDKPGREIQTLSQVDLVADHPAVERSLERLEAAGAWFRFLRAVLPDGVPAESLFALAVTALERLVDAPPERLGRWQAYHRLAAGELLGVAPRIEACAACGRDLPDAGELRFSVEEGGVLCARCAAGGRSGVPLGRRAYAVLTLYAHPDWTLVSEMEGHDAVERDVQRALERFLTWHADLRPDAPTGSPR